MTNVHIRVNNAKIGMPYQFIGIEIDEHQDNLTQRRDLNQNSNILKSGSLKCSLQVLNALTMGNEHSQSNENNNHVRNQENNNSGDTVVHPLKVENKQSSDYFISPYTLKGCIRQFIASFKNIPMRQLENEAFFYRPNQFFSNNPNLDFAAGIVKTVHPDGSIDVSLFKPPFYFGGPQNFMNNHNGTLSNNFSQNLNFRIQKRKVFFDHSGPKNGNFAFFPYRDGIDGDANFSRLFGQVKTHTVLGIGRSSQTGITATADSNIVQQYNELPELIIQYHMAGHPLIKDDTLIPLVQLEKNIRKKWEIKKNDLILYEYDTVTHKILSMGKHYRYLWSYRNRIWDFKEVWMIDVNDFQENRLWITDEMFGYSLSSSQKDHIKGKSEFDIDEKDESGKPKYHASKSGKVHFNFAKYVKGSGSVQDNLEIPGTGSPHASSYEFYLKQNPQRNGSEPLNNYGDRLEPVNCSSLSGRKIYRRSLNYQQNINNQRQNAPFLSKLEKVFISSDNNMAEFKFTVNFENLSDNEYHLLLFSLTLGNNSQVITQEDGLNKHCHQIGYGKNFGMGAVKIRINEINTVLLGEDGLHLEKVNDSSQIDTVITDNTEALSESLAERQDFNAMKLTNDTFQYPTDQQTGTIYAWHGKVREQDHKNRKANY